MALVHHELCFGCGRTNLFGLLLEAEHTEPDAVSGRCFIKQDHQGAHRGRSHEGILATAMIEAMALACETDVLLRTFELTVERTIPVGEYVAIEARLERRVGEDLVASARAQTGSDHVCSASGSFRMWPPT